MENLNELELTLLNGLSTKYPSLQSHIPYLKVEKREHKGMSMCVNFVYTHTVGQLKLEDINALFSNAENIEIRKLKHGLSYVIDVTNGEIQYIEFTTYGESWNGIINEFKIGLPPPNIKR